MTADGTASTPRPGDIGPYEVLEELGRGGMGVVYRARHRELGREVALKLLTVQGAGAEARERFAREARLAARLSHPRLVRVHEVGEDGGRPYIALAYVAGEPLQKVLDQRRITLEWALTLVRRVAEGLHYAHGQGVVHRDVKPSNILVDADDFPHLTDFGLARELASDQGLSLTGQVLGTPAYMAPEQARGEHGAVGPASDVWSLGAVLYEMLSLSPPFGTGSPGEVLARVLGEDPRPLRRVAPWVPPEVETMVGKALEKEPARRYASAGALAEDIGRFLQGRTIVARAPSLAWRAWKWVARNRALAAVLAASLAGLSLGAVHLRRREAVRRSAAECLRQARDLGATSSHRGNLEAVQPSYDAAVEADPGWGRAWFERGRVRAKLGDLEGALEDLRRATSLDESLSEAAYLAGKVLLVLRPAEAAAAFEEARRADPEGPHGRAARVALGVLGGRWPQDTAGVTEADLWSGLVAGGFGPGPAGGLEPRIADGATDPTGALAALERHVAAEPLDPVGRRALASLRAWARDPRGTPEDLPPSPATPAWVESIRLAAEAARRGDVEGLRAEVRRLAAGELPILMSIPEDWPAERLDLFLDVLRSEALSAVGSPFLASPPSREELRGLFVHRVSRVGRNSLGELSRRATEVLRLSLADPDLARMASVAGELSVPGAPGPWDFALVLRAVDLHRVDDEAHALRWLERAGLLREAGDLLALARGAWLEGDEDHALDLLRRASDHDPYLLEAHYGRTVLAARTGEREEALGSLRMALLAGWDRPEETRSDPDLEPLRADGRFARALDLAR